MFSCQSWANNWAEQLINFVSSEIKMFWYGWSAHERAECWWNIQSSYCISSVGNGAHRLWIAMILTGTFSFSDYKCPRKERVWLMMSHMCSEMENIARLWYILQSMFESFCARTQRVCCPSLSLSTCWLEYSSRSLSTPRPKFWRLFLSVYSIFLSNKSDFIFGLRFQKEF